MSVIGKVQNFEEKQRKNAQENPFEKACFGNRKTSHELTFSN